MCGITGYLNKNNKEEDYLNNLIKRINNRGPDSNGKWVDKNLGVYIGHTRLSILDISAKGNQPMISKSKRFIISFNGEIYNHKEIRKKIEERNQNIKWIGSSDTETICAAIENWGVDQFINHLNGMFAICVWDTKEKNLYLIRDRLGEKPIYYYRKNQLFIFGSTLNSIEAHPKFKKKICKDAFEIYMRYGFIKAPYSIYENTYKLLPSKILKYSYSESKIEINDYWTINKNRDSIITGITKNEIKDLLHQKLYKSVKSRMISDVAIGGFLSGGIDSSLICSLMQRNQTERIKTFTIGFEDAEYNESKDAKVISKIIGTDHTETILNQKEINNSLQDVLMAWDEPFADVSKIPTLLLAKTTRKEVKVSLSGDGGDELFGGYKRYKQSILIRKIFKYYAPLVDNLIKHNYLNKFNKYIDYKLKQKISRLLFLIKESNEKNYYTKFMWFSHNYKKIISDYSYNNYLDNYSIKNDFCSMTNEDLKNYLPNNILTKIDRSSMFFGLEARCPYLDYELVDWIINLKSEQRFYPLNNKYFLKKILTEYIPKSVIQKRKKGFTIPLSKWLRTLLKEWASNYILNESCYGHKLIDQEKVKLLWYEHQNKINEWHRELWLVICFNSWYINSNKISI